MQIQKLFKFLLAPRISFKEKMFLSEHLAVMLKAGIPLDRAIQTLADQSSNKPSKTILLSIGEDIKKGQPLSVGLQKFEYTFGAFFINMVAAGEYSGKLEDALKNLHIQIKKDYDLRSKVIGAMTYPAFVVLAMLGIGTAMMMFVIPKLIPIFASFGTQLPIATRVLIFVANTLSQYGLWVALGLIVGGIIFFKLIRGPARKIWHALLLKLPAVGNIFRNLNIARCCRTLSTLLATDILVVKALEITANIMGNVLYKNALLNSAQQVQQGVNISESLKPLGKLFPPTVLTMVAVGEESGNLQSLLDEVANFYEEQVDAATKNFSSIIEPVLIVVLGLAIGGIAIAILTPMYTLMDQI